MPSIADVKRQRASHKKLLPDSVDIWRRPTGVGVDTGAYAYNSTNKCRIATPMNNPRADIYNTAFGDQESINTEDTRTIEIGWDAVIKDDDLLYVTERISGTVSKYKVLHKISDVSHPIGILVKAQKI